VNSVKRVLIVSQGYPSPINRHGFGFVHARAKIYINYGLKSIVFVPDNKVDHYIYEGVKVFRGPYGLLLEIIKTFDPDVTAVHAPTPTILKYLIKDGVPKVAWIHGAEVLLRSLHHYVPPFGVKNNISKLYLLLYDLYRNELLRSTLKSVEAVVYVSRWMQRMTERYLRLKHPNSFIIPNPVDTDLFRPLPELMEEKRKDCISVRALEWKYGIDIAVKAFSKSRIKLVVFGKGSLENYIRRLIRTYDANVELVTTGVEHGKLPEIYNRFAIFVAPSRTEAQGVAMCEAMSSGLPVVATRVGGIPEFVINGYNGLLVPPEDSVSLRRAVRILLTDSSLYEELSKNARKFAINTLSHRVIFEKELNAFKSAIQQHSSAGSY